MILDRPLVDDAATPGRKPRISRGLTARLMAIAVGFVILTEAIVFLPSIGTFRHEWLVDRFDTGELAVFASRSEEANGVETGDAKELLRAAEIIAIASIEDNVVRPLIGRVPDSEIVVTDLEKQTFGGAIFDALEVLVTPGTRYLSIVARPRSNAAIKLQVLVPEKSLKVALQREMGRVLLYSLLLAVMMGLLLYSALADGFVRPMRRLTYAITRFRSAPENAARVLVPSGRNDEIGEAEIAFADMQETIKQSLFQKERLAQLGLSVSKISHDLRHSLGAAQLVSERLASIDDPVVQVTVPRLERALERAIGLAQSTLKFGKAQEAMPDVELLYLTDVVEEAGEDALSGKKGVTWVINLDTEQQIEVDPDQIHRVLSNLIRNAAQAIEASGREGQINVSATSSATKVSLLIEDTGPGLPRNVQENLFMPFAGSGLTGGTGLGLAIARELARLNGGEVTLVSTGPQGTSFRVDLPTASDGGDVLV